MNMLNTLMNDPVVLISFIGLGIILGSCGFYVWYFLKNIDEAKEC